MIGKPFCLEVESQYACFTRPESKAERVSFEVPTPSAVRAVFEAIFWKPAIKWHPIRLEVLNPIRWLNFRRNEVSAVASTKLIEKCIKTGGPRPSIFVEDKRQQRSALILYDVRYRFFADLEFIPVDQRLATGSGTKTPVDPEEAALMAAVETPVKYHNMFYRRASRGQCFMRPYLGCKEFAADFRLVDDTSADPSTPIAETRDLGRMFFDYDYSNPDDPQPLFFNAALDNGVVSIPNVEDVKKEDAQ